MYSYNRSDVFHIVTAVTYVSNTATTTYLAAPVTDYSFKFI
jgi:hypothetical protein